MESEGTMQASKEGKQPVALASYDAHGSQQPAGYNNLYSGAVLAHRPW